MQDTISQSQPLYLFIPADWPVWTALILAGAAIQALSLLPALRRATFPALLRPALIAFGGVLVLIAAAKDRDHLVLVSQIAVWIFLWRGVVRQS